MEDERVALARLQRRHLAGDDHVVAAGDHVAKVAGDEGEGVVDCRDAGSLAPGNPLPLVGHRGLGGEGAGKRLLTGVQDADSEAVCRLHGEQGARAAVEAGQHQHRLDRE